MYINYILVKLIIKKKKNNLKKIQGASVCTGRVAASSKLRANQVFSDITK